MVLLFTIQLFTFGILCTNKRKHLQMNFNMRDYFSVGTLKIDMNYSCFRY